MRIFMVLAASLAPSVALAGPAPSLSCIFTEPYADIQVWPNGMRASQAQSVPVTNVVIRGTAQEPVIQARVGGIATTLTIRNDVGGDGMSEFVYPFEGSLTGWLNADRTQLGGCVRFPDGAIPRQIHALPRNRLLIIRARPTATGRAVGEEVSGSLVWLLSSRATNGWVRVAFVGTPTNDNAARKIGQGWVQARYLTAPTPR